MGSRICKCCCQKTDNNNVIMEYVILNDYNDPMIPTGINPKFKAEYQASIEDLFITDISPLSKQQSFYRRCCECLCCTDLVSPLSKQARIVQLTHGYIRKHYGYPIPKDLHRIILGFVGGVSGFCWTALMTSKEIRAKQPNFSQRISACFSKQTKQISACLRHITCKSRAPLECCAVVAIYAVVAICCLVLFGAVGADIACLIINGYNHCNDTMDGTNHKYVTFDLNAWILYGSISHIAASTLFICFGITCLFGVHSYPFRIRNWLRCVEDVGGDLLSVTVICIAFPWCFFVSWMVIGFLFYSEMDNSDKQCTNAVLSWLIIQALGVIVVPVVGFVWFILIVLCLDG